MSELATTHNINTRQLAEIATFDDALALMRETYGESSLALASEALGDGFALVKEKDSLIGVPMAFVMWTEVASDADNSLGEHGYIVARVVTARGEKLVITDGSSTGINMQLRQFSAEHDGRCGGLISHAGLRRSDYTYEDEGKQKKASTHYIDTSADKNTPAVSRS